MGIFLRSLGMGIVVVSLWTYFVPLAFGFHPRPGIALTQLRTIIGICALCAGVALWLACLVQFAFEGHGTLLPIDAPRHLVVGGLYRYVRNPMYLAVVTIIVGEAIAVANVDRYLLIYFASLAVVTIVFVRFYEEPHLRKLFGAGYDDYCAHVQRWLPRLHPWTPQPRSEVGRQP